MEKSRLQVALRPFSRRIRDVTTPGTPYLRPSPLLRRQRGWRWHILPVVGVFPTDSTWHFRAAYILSPKLDPLSGGIGNGLC